MMYNEKSINSIRDYLLKNEETIAVAESVTSGHLQAAFSCGEEAGKFFQGGLTAYNAGQKTRHFSIEPIYAEKVNCVAKKVSEKMALEVCNLFLSQYGIGITGYATMVPECEEEGLHAWFSIAWNNKILISKKIKTDKIGVDAQVDYTNQVIEHLNKYLIKK